MNEGLNLPRLQILNDWIVTKSDIDAMTEKELIDVVKEQKVKVMITDGTVSTVIISPDLYNTRQGLSPLSLLRGRRRICARHLALVGQRLRLARIADVLVAPRLPRIHDLAGFASAHRLGAA